MDLKKLSKEVDRRICLSSGFAGSETKAIGNHEKEVEGGSMDAEKLEGAIQKRLAKLAGGGQKFSYKGKTVEIVNGPSGYFYKVNGEASIVKNWGDDITATNNAKHDIDQGYWD